MSRPNPTIKNVAECAGVSTQTVSRVLNNSNKVRTETRRRVLSAISSLQYVPDGRARALTTGRSFVLGVIVRNFGYTPSLILEGAVAGAREWGYQVLIAEYADGTERQSPSAVMARQHMDGLLVVYQGSDEERVRHFPASQPHIPIVTIGHELEGPNVTRIEFANRQAAVLACRHLIEEGHSRIAMIQGTRHYHNAQERSAGYRQVLKENGIPFAEDLILEGDWTSQSGYRAAMTLLDRHPAITAIFCQNDLMAIGCVRALAERGRAVPDHVAVVGFDDIQPSRYVAPALTTIRYPAFDLGRLCIWTLVARVNGDDEAPESRFPDLVAGTEPKLVIRESSRAASSARGRKADQANVS